MKILKLIMIPISEFIFNLKSKLFFFYFIEYISLVICDLIICGYINYMENLGCKLKLVKDFYCNH